MRGPKRSCGGQGDQAGVRTLMVIGHNPGLHEGAGC